MIVVEKPTLQNLNDGCRISCNFSINGEIQNLWYNLSCRFSEYLVTERSDAFLVGLLFLGLKTGNDIYLKGKVSARLIYAINHYLINALCIADSTFTKIKVKAEELSCENLNFRGVAGTGMSCGIDSFATYYDHSEDEGPFKIDFLTNFNVGSHLDNGGEKARLLFHKRLTSVEEFARLEGKEVISVDSNLSELLKLNFQKTHTLRSISCVLLFQKLFSNYYYSSAYRFDHFELNSADTSDADLLILQLLSTESTTLYSSAAQYSRVERTLIVAKHPRTRDFLDVCTDPPKDSPFLNCSRCYKCLRTQLTLEIAGALENYQKVFNLDVYEKKKTKYIGNLIGNRQNGDLDLEVLNFLKRENFRIPTKSYYYAFQSVIYIYINKIKRKVKQVLKPGTINDEISKYNNSVCKPQ